MVPTKIFKESDGRDLSVSGTNTYYSEVFGVDADVWSVFLQHGNITGTLTAWATNKPDPDLADDDDWVEVTLSLTNPAGAGKTGAEVGLAGYAKYRLKYVNSSGSGLLAGYYHGKPRR